MPRLLIADEYDVVRIGLRAILEAQPGWVVVAEAADGKDAILKAINHKPDVAVINASLPVASGIEVTRQIRSRFRRTEVLVFAIDGDGDPTQLRALIKAGARGFLTISMLQNGLVEAVGSLLTHKPFLTASVTEELLTSYLRRSRAEPSLSDRERAVLRLVTEGHTNRQIAILLNTNLKSVKRHCAIMMRKLDLSSRAALKRHGRNRMIGAKQLATAPVQSSAADLEQSRLMAS
jgi:DNA-binding NarL/FixJ family response regulator